MIVEETRSVLAALQRNAKENAATIAKQCHMSKNKLLKTIRHLEKNQKIWGYSAVVDEDVFPYKKFVLLIKRNSEKMDASVLSKTSRENFEHVYNELGVRIEGSYCIYGEYDWLILFTARDLGQAKKFNSILFDHYSGFMENAHLMEVLFTHRAHFILNPNPSTLFEIL